MRKKNKAFKIIALVLALVCVLTFVGNVACMKLMLDKIETFPESGCEKFEFENYSNGCYNITTDGEFKVMQITDVHIGGGWLSVREDTKALNAVAAMITAEKPDFVIFTGDQAFPVPYASGTLNNKTGTAELAKLMEKLGVYWTASLGNHDSEIYSYYNREKISNIYSSDEYPHCLFQAGPDNVDGYGNQVFNIRNADGEIMRSIIIFDSHAYTDGDYLGIRWLYDNIHENQVDWYEKTLDEITEMNGGKEVPTSVMMHIPLVECKDAWYEYLENDTNDTENVKLVRGEIGEKEPYVFCGVHEDGLFEKILEKKSTDSIFFGHDHLNNTILNYKGIDLVYGYSIDYLAYSGIDKQGSQRGCVVLDIAEDGTQTITHENYYQDKYASHFEKEEVTM